MSREPESVRMIRAELQRYDGVSMHVERSNRHPVIHLHVDGTDKVEIITLSKSASDWRANKNARADVRKVLRAHGIVPRGKKK